jgi:peptidoglycan/xylan/chitin deacetylase (PgdA/CDA1 family)
MTHERAIALTFDDGPGPSTAALLDVLVRHGARATFFVTGQSLRGHCLDGDAAHARALALRCLREGHVLGNHLDTHARDPMPPAALVSELRRVDDALRGLYATAGVAAPTSLPVRLPYGPLVRAGGAMDERLIALAAAGRTHQHWTGIFDDWEPDTDADALADAVVAHVRGMWAEGLMAVPVLHDAGSRPRANGFDRSATVAAVARVCEALGAEWARYVTL